MLSYKLKMLTGELLLVPAYYTSQKCNSCGELVQKSLSVRTHICPYCGFTAISQTNGVGGARPSPEQVDGDLELLDPETIRQLIANTQLESPASIAQRVSAAISPAAGLSAMKKQAERIKTQKDLAESIAVWAGHMRNYHKYTDRQINKKFYVHFNMTITEALGEPREQMLGTIERLKDYEDYY